MHMASPRGLFPTLALALAAFYADGAFAQTMTEYGHLAGGAAKAATSLRKASPAGSLQKLESALGGSRQANPNRPFASLDTPVGPAGQRPEPAPGETLSVVRVDWGADSSQPPAEPAAPETALSPDVLESAEEKESFDAKKAGLETGMTVAEVSKILGDPAIHTAGLAGRGYDEKALYQLEAGWRVTVYASNGRVRDFTAVRDAKKSAQKNLSPSGSVIP